MRRLLENWRLLALAVALAAIAGESARAQAPGRTINEPTSGAPRAVAPLGPTAGPKTGPPVKTVGNGGQPPATAPAGAPPAAREPMAPFKLSPAEQQLLDEVLKKWEEHNSKVNTLKCIFERREYDDSLLDDLESAKRQLAELQGDPKADPARVAALTQTRDTLLRAQKIDFLRSEGSGVIKFKPPDQGMFQITKLKEFDPNVKPDPKKPLLVEVTENLEHWVCDGKAIHEFKPDPDKSKNTGEHLIHVIPQQMQGEAIADGPVPFIFGAKADKLKARYWLREATPKPEIGKHIWLEVYPKFQHDAANFHHVKVILSVEDHSLYALMIELPSRKQKSTFMFSNMKINDFLEIFKGDFDPPKTPRGWKRTIDPPPDAPTANNPDAPPAGSREAKRGAAAPKPR